MKVRKELIEMELFTVLDEDNMDFITYYIDNKNCRLTAISDVVVSYKWYKCNLGEPHESSSKPLSSFLGAMTMSSKRYLCDKLSYDLANAHVVDYEETLNNLLDEIDECGYMFKKIEELKERLKLYFRNLCYNEEESEICDTLERITNEYVIDDNEFIIYRYDHIYHKKNPTLERVVDLFLQHVAPKLNGEY